MSTRYFVVTNSFAAPFVSDQDTTYVRGTDPEDAMERCAKAYKHPAGLYAAALYASADAYHLGEKPLVRWLCNHEQAKQRATVKKGSYSYSGNGPGDFQIDGKRITVEDPKGGSVVGPE